MPSAPDPSDAALVARARDGDAPAFEALVRRHWRAAYAAALGITGTMMDAEDLAQEAFVAALEHLDDCREPARFGAWVARIARNRALNLVASPRWRGADLDEETLDPGASPAQETARRELRELLERALGGLSDAQREVVVLHDLEGWDHRAIAAHLGCSEVMSRQHLFRARRALRARLGPQLAQEYFHE